MRSLLFLLMLLTACSGEPDADLWVEGSEFILPDGSNAAWFSAFGLDHPLAGRVWQPAQKRYADPQTVVAAVRAASFVLLGEKHDNVDHHRIQAWLLSRLAQDHRRPAVAFEMFTTDHEQTLAAHLAARPGDAASLGEVLAWAESGWPDWALYQPVVQAAIDAGAPLLAGGLPRSTLRAIAREGVGALGPDQVGRLGLDRSLPADATARLRLEIIDNHCRQLPETMIDPMVTITVAKDAYMAAAMVRGARMPGRDSAVLVAGGGHVRADRGVPWHLRRMAPSQSAVAIGLLEVRRGNMDPASYVEGFHADDLPFDFVWFTPRTDEADPCEIYAEQLRRARERHLEQQQE